MPTLTLDQAAKFYRALNEEMRKAALKGLRSAGARGLQLLQASIIPSRTPQPVDRGVYRAGWRMVMTPNGVDIYNAETHAAFIEYGVRPENVRLGRQMLAALAAWAIRKGIASGPREASDMAWRIGKAMEKRGIFNRDGKNGLGIMAELAAKLPAIAQQEIERAVAASFGS